MLERQKSGVMKRAVAEHGGNCLKTNDMYLAGDRAKYGMFRPEVCVPGDVTVTRSEILHESTSNKDGKAESVPSVVNPWFVGIQPDHETTEIPESRTWSELATFHREFTAPKTTPSGQQNSHGYPLQRFPASVPLRHVSHLSDALLGLARWDDPMVQYEAAILLGDDDHASHTFVIECR